MFEWLEDRATPANVEMNPLLLVPGAFARATTTDSVGNFYVAGQFHGEVDFDPGPELNWWSADGTRGFVAKYAPNGSLMWVPAVGDHQADAEAECRGVSVDSTGAVFVTGFLVGNDEFAPDDGGVNPPGSGQRDLFVLKLDN